MISNTATIIAAVAGMAVTGILGIWMIPYLKKVKFGQTINDVGPTWHKSKQGTPTMGGFMFIIGIVIAVALGYATVGLSGGELFSVERQLSNTRVLIGLAMALAYGFLGFVDDYIKVVKKRNLGLTARQKMVMQCLIGILYLAAVYIAGDRSTVLWIPFIGGWDIGVFYYPLMLFIIVGFVNAVNLTDGIDGLAASVTFVVALAYMAVSAYLSAAGMNIFSAALAGGCLGFLLWNFHPAKVFMGDTGSMFLGGAVVALSFDCGMPLLLVFVGVIYWIEALSVMLQVTSFKLTGKRIFKMSPIHHHFEMSGFSEVKIVLLFSLVALAGCVLGVWSVFRMFR